MLGKRCLRAVACAGEARCFATWTPMDRRVRWNFPTPIVGGKVEGFSLPEQVVYGEDIFDVDVDWLEKAKSLQFDYLANPGSGLQGTPEQWVYNRIRFEMEVITTMVNWRDSRRGYVSDREQRTPDTFYKAYGGPDWVRKDSALLMQNYTKDILAGCMYEYPSFLDPEKRFDVFRPPTLPPEWSKHPKALPCYRFYPSDRVGRYWERDFQFNHPMPFDCGLLLLWDPIHPEPIFDNYDTFNQGVWPIIYGVYFIAVVAGLMYCVAKLGVHMHRTSDHIGAQYLWGTPTEWYFKNHPEVAFRKERLMTENERKYYVNPPAMETPGTANASNVEKLSRFQF